MKKLVYFSVAFFALSLLACQDDKEEVKTGPDLSYVKSIGHQIPTETGYRWMDFYRTKANLGGREKPSGYAISKENLAELSNSVNGLVGIAFHHALDDAGEHHFLIIPIGETLAVWSDDKVIVDANADAVIAKDVAKQWALNYKNANPEAIWVHLFGKSVFDDMNAVPFFEYIQVEPAVNDENQAPQVLLLVNDLSLNESSGGRENLEVLVYDASAPLPCSGCALADLNF